MKIYSISCSLLSSVYFAGIFWKLFCSGSTYGTQCSAYGISFILGDNHISIPHPHFQEESKQQHNFNIQLTLCIFLQKRWPPTRKVLNLIMHSPSLRVVNEKPHHLVEWKKRYEGWRRWTIKFQRIRHLGIVWTRRNQMMNDVRRKQNAFVLGLPNSICAGMDGVWVRVLLTKDSEIIIFPSCFLLLLNHFEIHSIFMQIMAENGRRSKSLFLFYRVWTFYKKEWKIIFAYFLSGSAKKEMEELLINYASI